MNPLYIEAKNYKHYFAQNLLTEWLNQRSTFSTNIGKIKITSALMDYPILKNKSIDTTELLMNEVFGMASIILDEGDKLDKKYPYPRPSQFREIGIGKEEGLLGFVPICITYKGLPEYFIYFPGTYDDSNLHYGHSGALEIDPDWILNQESLHIIKEIKFTKIL
jgi:hypothetical protein